MNTFGGQLARSPDSVWVARHLVNSHTASFGFQQRHDVALIVSELVADAVQHGVGAISLRADVEGDAVRIEVGDEGRVALAPSPEPGAHGGWGLRIVERLADDWGVLDGRTRVWFRLGRPRSQR
jgi:anti-sigma regulatory factor (Ser/Thr protein kinase)